MSEWKQGTVLSRAGRQKISVGDRWVYWSDDDDAFTLHLNVVAVSAEGEVVLRPTTKDVAEAMFPEREVLFKGKAIKTRPTCPFHWVSTERAKGGYQEGDLLAHEAWSVWQSMMTPGQMRVTAPTP